MVMKSMTRSPQKAALWLALACGLSAVCRAGDVRLKNGMVFEGTPARVQALSLAAARQNPGPVAVYPILLVDDGMRRIFVPQRQASEVNEAADLARYEMFELKQHHTSRKPMLASLEGYAETTEFNEFGQRTHTVNTNFGPKQIVVGVEKLTPKIVYLTGINYEWEHAIATTSVPPEALDVMLRKCIDVQNPDDRLAVARFYLQAGMHPQCAAELDAIVRDFPELKQRAEEIRQQLRQLQARLILQELHRRKAAGQHKLASASLASFPTEEMSAAVLREVREFSAEYTAAREKADRALLLLGDLQAQLSDPDVVSSVMPLRSIVRDELNYDTLGRLDAFLNLANDSTLSASEKLALAYSGWVLGSPSALTDLNAATSLWKARFLVLEYLRTESAADRAPILQQLQSVEGVGPERIAQMIPQLPALVEMPEAQPLRPLTIEVADRVPGDPPRYSVLLPEEYNPHHSYPLIVALRPAERPVEQELLWWGGTAENPGQASRRGYIVIAPEYAAEQTRIYDYDVAGHDVVIRSINDARKRFRIDSDRIFLAGHGMGADAAYDIGMSHPDLFAGVIPISGQCDHYCKWYWGSTGRDTTVVNRMMLYAFDVVYVEYAGRGYESYYEEIHRLFDWMDGHRRQKHLKEFELKILRPSENRCQWIQLEGFPDNVTQSAVLGGKGRGQVTPMVLNVRLLPGNVVYLRSGADRHSLWFAPEFADYEKRLTIRQGGRIRFNDFLKPSIAVLLEDLRTRGDREMLFTSRVDLD